MHLYCLVISNLRTFAKISKRLVDTLSLHVVDYTGKEIDYLEH